MEALSKPELLAVLRAARQHSERDFLMILVAYSHGLRASELVAIQRDDIQGGSLDVQRLKGSRRTNQPLLKHENPLLNEHLALSAFLRNMQPKQRVFPLTRRQFGRIVTRHAETAGLPEHRRNPHILKHTIGTEIYQKTKDLRLLQSHLGHVRESSSLIYARRVADAVAANEVQALVNLP